MVQIREPSPETDKLLSYGPSGSPECFCPLPSLNITPSLASLEAAGKVHQVAVIGDLEGGVDAVLGVEILLYRPTCIEQLAGLRVEFSDEQGVATREEEMIPDQLAVTRAFDEDFELTGLEGDRRDCSR